MNEVTIGLLCSIGGVILGWFGFLRLSKQDAKDEGGSIARVEAKLDYVGKGVDDIRLDIRDQGRKIETVQDRLTRVEESTKSAHKRLDGLGKEEMAKNG
jgi:hypothetical protein